jgi:predicted lactoylglutathione lyase
MPTQIFVNLPVKDLQKAMEFFAQLGFTFNKQFTDENAACMIIGENIYSMLLTHKHFKGFMPGGKEIADAHKTTEALVAVTCESRAAVDEMVRKAVAAGGTTYNKPQDHGFMYAHGFQDLDGHVWEPLWMDPSAVKGG